MQIDITSTRFQVKNRLPVRYTYMYSDAFYDAFFTGVHSSTKVIIYVYSCADLAFREMICGFLGMPVQALHWRLSSYGIPEQAN